LTEQRIMRHCDTEKASAPPRAIAGLIKRIGKHFDGDLQDFRDVVVDLDGVAPLGRQIYEAVRQIPVGRTRSYGEIAHDVGRPAAARAVGNALKKNPVALIIPCHRVLAAGGRPGGFSAHGGMATKASLLAAEGVTFGRPATIASERALRRAIALLKERDPTLAPCFARPITLKQYRRESPYAMLFEAIVHQQLTPKAAATILGRVKALYPGATIPEPERLLETPDELLRNAGLSGAKTASLKDLARKSIDGIVPSSEEIAAMSDDAIVRRLTTIRGIGRWTVEMLLIFQLHRADVFPVDDYALRKMIAELYGMEQVPTARQLEGFGESWRPLRTVASLALWNAIKGKGDAAQSAEDE
jgi:methylated-DNA-[protein]-cysteine S-methyltransferase